MQSLRVRMSVVFPILPNLGTFNLFGSLSISTAKPDSLCFTSLPVGGLRGCGPRTVKLANQHAQVARQQDRRASLHAQKLLAGIIRLLLLGGAHFAPPGSFAAMDSAL